MSLPSFYTVADPHPQTDSGSITNWADKTGEFKRGQSQFRNWVSKKPGAEFPPEKGRYHLYISYACPWGQFSSCLTPVIGN